MIPTTQTATAPAPAPAAAAAAVPAALPVLDRAQPLYDPHPHGMPWSSALVNGTMVLTGVGQMMNGQVGKGVIIFVVHWVLGFSTCFATVPFTALLASLDSWLIGRKMRSGRRTSAWEFF
jgi:hypothetical protein